MTSPPLGDVLPHWLARQRWYTAKGRQPRLRRAGGLRFPVPGGEADLETWLLVDDAGERPTLYQVPLTWRSAPVPGLEHALVTRTEDAELGPRWVYDGCHDPAGARTLLDTVLEETAVTTEGPVAGSARGHRAEGAGAVAGPVAAARSRVLSGEQSNTSIIFEGGPGTPVILKLFRVLAAGENPDVTIQQALAAAGSRQVPAPLGDLTGTWPDATGQPVRGHLAYAQEFLPEVEDAWRVAGRAARSATDFTGPAHELGRAVAAVHRDLATAFGRETTTVQARQWVRRDWKQRAAVALQEVPGLAEHAPAVAEVYQRTEAATWPALQRVHGDLHLGQVIDVPGRGWLLLDFEGEPLRPLAERTAPDLALRDVAGMLRSLDYAVGAVALTEGDSGAGAGAGGAGWAQRSRDAFLEGYAAVAGRDPRADAALLAALELDKALYEAVYEARNRPDWLAIPVAGVRRLLAP